MSFLWGSSSTPQSQFDQLIEQCTSDRLPAHSPLDLDAALRLADLVRSAAVPATTAARQLVTRLEHQNPTVQLLALDLADLLVKNAGNQFLAAFASAAATSAGAVRALERLADGGPSVNRDVQLAARTKLQDWATAFQHSHRSALVESDLVRLYDRLARRSHPPPVEFPPKPTAALTAAMVDSLAAPDWSDSAYCTRCRTEFSTFNRKHHCRNCGQVFDQQCSSQSLPLPHYGIPEPVRVCDACAKKIKDGKGADVGRSILQQQQAQKSAADTAKSKPAGVVSSSREQEDADLQRAIQASLAESASAASHGPLRAPSAPSAPSPAAPTSTSGYTPSYAAQVQGAGDKKGKGEEEEEEEDPDLAAAIAASLRDLQPPASAPLGAGGGGAAATSYRDLFPSSAPGSASGAAPVPAPAPGASFRLPSYDLSPSDHQHLESFIRSQLSPSSGALSAGPAEYDAVRERLQPQLGRSWEDARRRGEILREMEGKLAEAARIYGAGLTERAQVAARGQARQAYDRPASQQQYPSSPYNAPYSQPYDPHAQAYAQQYPHAHPHPQQHAYAAPPEAVGRPLPAYAVPEVVAPAPASDPESAMAPAPAPAQPQQGYEQQQPQQPPPQPPQQQQAPVPAGYYKPSQFPAAPQGGLLSGRLPEVPREEPWAREGHGERTEEEQEEEQERGRVGELIQF